MKNLLLLFTIAANTLVAQTDIRIKYTFADNQESCDADHVLLDRTTTKRTLRLNPEGSITRKIASYVIPYRYESTTDQYLATPAEALNIGIKHNDVSIIREAIRKGAVVKTSHLLDALDLIEGQLKHENRESQNDRSFFVPLGGTLMTLAGMIERGEKLRQLKRQARLEAQLIIMNHALQSNSLWDNLFSKTLPPEDLATIEAQLIKRKLVWSPPIPSKKELVAAGIAAGALIWILMDSCAISRPIRVPEALAYLVYSGKCTDTPDRDALIKLQKIIRNTRRPASALTALVHALSQAPTT